MNVTGLRFAANLSIIYGHLPLLSRPAAAAADGFTGSRDMVAVHRPGPA